MKRVILSLIVLLSLILITGISLGDSIDYARDELLIKFREGVKIKRVGKNLYLPESKQWQNLVGEDLIVSSRKVFKVREDDSIAKQIGLNRWYLYKFREGVKLEELKSELSNLKIIEAVDFNYKRHLDAIPNDPRFEDQWNMEKIMAPEAWDYEVGSSEVVVAVIDTGLNLNHEDLVANLWTNTDEIPNNGIDDDGNGYEDDYNGYDFSDRDPDPTDNTTGDGYGHGTMVAGVIGAVGNNGKGVAGLNWECKLMILKIFPQAYVDRSAEAIRYAVDNGAKVINCSYGGGHEVQVEREATEYAYQHNVVICAAAGNNGTEGCEYPANYPTVFAVGWTARFDNLSPSSNYGECLEFCAPGTAILTTYVDGGYKKFMGTSAASPHGAGLAALLFAQNPDATVDYIKMRIRGGCDNIDDANPDKVGKLGAGRINAYYSIIETSLVQIKDFEFIDEGGDHDYQADSGEHLSLYITFKNQSWKDASNISVTLKKPEGSNYDWIELVDTESTLPDLASKEEAQNVTAFSLNILENAPFNSEATLEVEIVSDDATWVDSFTFSINDPHPPLKNWPKDTGTDYIYSSPVAVDLIPGDGNEKNLIIIDGKANLHVFKPDGSELNGFPFLVTTDPEDQSNYALSTPAVGDVDNDGDLEIVFAYIHVVNESDKVSYIEVIENDGTVAPGWPKEVNKDVKASPVLYDLDGDNTLEIIVGTYDNKVFIWDYQGNNFEGWPISFIEDIFSTPAVSDLDNDGTPEIFIAIRDIDDEDPDYDGRAFLFSPSGDILNGWPKNFPTHLYPSAALADFDQDNELEIITACGDYKAEDLDNNFVFVWNKDGTDVPGFPVQVSNSVYSSPAVGDIDNDGQLEIAVGTLDNKIYVIDNDGTVLNGFPVEVGDKIYSSITLADLNNDGYLEIVFGCNDNNLYAIDINGENLPGFPIEVQGEIFATPLIEDLNNDGFLEITVCDFSGKVYIWTITTPYKESKVEWRRFRNHLHNIGLYNKQKNNPPEILMFGYWDSYVKSTQSSNLNIIALVNDKDGLSDINKVELYYQHSPTSVQLYDDGMHNDFSANDGIYGLTIPIPGKSLPGNYKVLLELRVTDNSGNVSTFYPYLTVQ